MILSENDLISGLRGGDKAAFDQLFRTYYSHLCRYARGYIKSGDSSDEVVHEVFIRLWENHEKINIVTSIRSYLYKSVSNACINYLKKIQAESTWHPDIENNDIQMELMLMESSDEAFSRQFSEETEKELQQAIDELPQQCREIFSLCRFENMSYPEISQKLDLSLSTVKTQMSRAMEKLFTRMEKFL